MRKLPKLMMAGAMAGALALAGCSTDDSDEAVQDQVQPTDAATTEGGEATQEESPEDSAAEGKERDLLANPTLITPDEAMSIGQQEAGGGIVYKLKIDWSDDHDAWKWEVKVLNGTTEYEVELDAMTGDILETDSDSTDDSEQAIDLQTMSPEDAMKKAQEKGEGRVSEWKLQWDDGRMIYEVELTDASGNDTEYNVDTASGEVILDD